MDGASEAMLCITVSTLHHITLHTLYHTTLVTHHYYYYCSAYDASLQPAAVT